MALVKIDERDLVLSHRAGDVDAFPEIVRLHYRVLLGHAMRKLGDHAAAEDAVQETFLRAYRALPGFGGDFRLAGWLHRILSNVCADETGRRSRDAQAFDLVVATTEELEPDLADAATTRAAVGRALAMIPTGHRDALLLREVEGLNYDEVALATGITVENARARVHRARSALRRILTGPAAAIAAVTAAARRYGQAAKGTAGAHAAAVQGVADPIVVQLTASSAGVNAGRLAAIGGLVGTIAAGTMAVVPSHGAPHLASTHESRSGAVVVRAADSRGIQPVTSLSDAGDPSTGAGTGSVGDGATLGAPGGSTGAVALDDPSEPSPTTTTFPGVQDDDDATPTTRSPAAPEPSQPTVPAAGSRPDCTSVVPPPLVADGDNLSSAAKVASAGQIRPNGPAWLSSDSTTPAGKLAGTVAWDGDGDLTLTFRPRRPTADAVLRLTGAMTSSSQSETATLYEFSGTAREFVGTCPAANPDMPFVATVATHDDGRAPSIVVAFSTAPDSQPPS